MMFTDPNASATDPYAHSSYPLGSPSPFSPINKRFPPTAQENQHQHQQQQYGAKDPYYSSTPRALVSDPSTARKTMSQPPSRGAGNQRRKRQEVQWVNVNHPEDFRKAEVKKTVRSHAMKDYLSQKEGHGSSSSSGSSSSRPQMPRRDSPAHRSSNSVTQVMRAPQPRLPWAPPPEVGRFISDADPHIISTLRPEPAGTNYDDIEVEWGELLISPVAMSAQYDDTGVTMVMAPPRLFKPRPGRTSALLQSTPLYHTFSQQTRELMEHHFASFNITRSQAWIEAMLENHLTRLSFLSMAALHRATLRRSEENIAEYYTLRAEVFKAMRDSLAAREVGDDTFIGVYQQIMMDMLSSTYDGIQHHIMGFEQMARQRGGLDSTGLPGEIAQSFFGLVLTVGVVFQIRPGPFYLNFTPSNSIDPYHIRNEMLESPLFCNNPSYGLESLLFVENCTWETYDVLCEMATLTRQVLDQGDRRDVVYAEDVFRRLLLPRSQQIPTASANLPRPAQLMQSAAEDTIYEPVRLAGMLYTAAIINMVPISQAVDLVSASLGVSPATFLTHMIGALSKSEYLDYWGSLASTFVWVSLIMGAASQHPILLNAERPWARVQLCMPAIYALGLVGTRGATVVFESIKTMIRVQERLAAGSTDI